MRYTDDTLAVRVKDGMSLGIGGAGPGLHQRFPVSYVYEDVGVGF